MLDSSRFSIAIVGTGAIGGLLGFKLAQAGERVTFFEQGERLSALKTQGISLLYSDGERRRLRDIHATDDFASAGAYDVVFLAVKAHQIESVAPQLTHLLHPETVLISLQNGIPWWYFQGLEQEPIACLDPNGTIARSVPTKHIVGCVAYPAATVEAPGVVRHIEGDRFPIGELDGSESDRCRRLVDMFERAGLRSRILPDIRAEIWLKAWGSLSLNPISALTRSTLQDLCRFGPTRTLAAEMMREAQTVAEKLGVTFRTSIERRLDGAEKVGAHKTSMLQDVESEQPMELQALIGAILELGERTGTPTPLIASVYALVGLLDRTVCQKVEPIEAAV